MVRDVDAAVSPSIFCFFFLKAGRERRKSTEKKAKKSAHSPTKKKTQDDLELLRCRSSGMELALVQGSDFTLVSVVLI